MILRPVSSLPNLPTAFGELDDMRRGMERLLDSLYRTSGQRASGVFPAVNLSEDSEAVYVRAELPGIDKDDLEITVHHGTLTVAGERKPPVAEEGVSMHRRERGYGRFRRSITVPTQIDPEHVRADYAEGILTIAMPKAPEARPRRIEIEA